MNGGPRCETSLGVFLIFVMVRAKNRVSSVLAVSVGLLWLTGALTTACGKEKKSPTATQTPAPAETPTAMPGATEKSAYPPSPASLGGPMKVPPSNPMTSAKVKLGHQLFFDPRMSASGKKSCYSCHQNEDGTGGHDPMAIKDNGKSAGRHAPVMWNVGYLPTLYWDGRAGSLEEQGLAAWAGMLGVGKENLAKKAAEIAAIPGYAAEFEAAFPGEPITPELVIKAIASYERTMVCSDTAYDKYQAGDTSAMTAQQVAGYKLFIGKARCTSCHIAPFFSDTYGSPKGAYHNVGVGTAGVPKKDVDVGRKKVTGLDSQSSAFKTPSLRNATKSAPYFHDGSAVTVEEATKLMASGGLANAFLDPQLADRKLTDKELARLVDFLGALECPGQLVKPSLPE